MTSDMKINDGEPSNQKANAHYDGSPVPKI
jgi:hypothetical protein